MKKLLIVLLLFLSLPFSFSNAGQADFSEPMGTIVVIGDHAMHLYDVGNGPIPVILDACLGCNFLEWTLVQPAVAQFARCISYDRSGLGWSDASLLPRTSLNIVEELRSLLRAADIQPPYILVGHSSGGINMRLFANLYPDEVYGLILVDSSHEHQIGKIQALQDRFQPPSVTFVRDISWLSAELHGLYEELYHNPACRAAGGKEMACFAESLKQVDEAPNNLTNKPLVVISRGTKIVDNASEERRPYEQAFHQVWREMQIDLVQKSLTGKHVIAPGAGHMIQRESPEIIIEAIRDVVTSYAAESLISFSKNSNTSGVEESISKK